MNLIAYYVGAAAVFCALSVAIIGQAIHTVA